MNVETATKIILRPYVTEKTFALVENEQKICFLVEKEATKPEIKEAVKTLYNEDAVTIDTCLLYTSPSPRDKRQSRMPSSA